MGGLKWFSWCLGRALGGGVGASRVGGIVGVGVLGGGVEVG